MSVIPALFRMLQVEVHLRMREICQQIWVTQKTIILIRNIQSIFDLRREAKAIFISYQKTCRKMVSIVVLGTWNLEILFLKKMFLKKKVEKLLSIYYIRTFHTF